MTAVVVALGVLAAVGIGVLLRAAAKGERTQLYTTRLRVLVPDLPEALAGWTLAFLSDLHMGRMYVSEHDLFQALQSLDPDYAVLAGDYAHSQLRREAAVGLLRELARRWPMVCTLGNTEHYQGWDVDRLRGELEQGGGTLLVNESHRVRVGPATVEFVGLDDPEDGQVDVEQALAGAAERPDLRLAVAHSPRIWPELGRLAAHILLCGHTHGGQVRLPYAEAPVVHKGLDRRLAAGLFRYRRGNDGRARMQRVVSHSRIMGAQQHWIPVTAAEGPLMYVTRGIGSSGPRVRLFCPPELVAIEFQPAESVGKGEGERIEGGAIR